LMRDENQARSIVGGVRYEYTFAFYIYLSQRVWGVFFLLPHPPSPTGSHRVLTPPQACCRIAMAAPRTAPRDPLSPLNSNTTLVASSPRSSCSRPVKEKKLAPIFLRTSRGTASSSSSSSSSSPRPFEPSRSLDVRAPVVNPGDAGSPARKRVRRGVAAEAEVGGFMANRDGDVDRAADASEELGGGVEFAYKVVRTRGHAKVPSVTDWFLPSTPSRGEEKALLRCASGLRREREVEQESEGVWRRPRRRLGVGGLRGDMMAMMSVRREYDRLQVMSR
jgi:hypothetical protein